MDVRMSDLTDGPFGRFIHAIDEARTELRREMRGLLIDKPKFVVITTNNEGSGGACLYATLDDAKDAIRRFMYDSENDPPITEDESQRLEAELRMVGGNYAESVSGSAAWKEAFYIAPIRGEL